MPPLPSDSESMRLAHRAAQGDEQALVHLMAAYRAPLRRMVALRLDRRLQGRIDASDVIQEAYIDVTRRLPEYAANPIMPFYLWLRFLAGQRLLEQHRRHLGAQSRNAGRELSLYQSALPETTTAHLAIPLLGRLSTPSQAAIHKEQKSRLQEGLNALEPIDREILTLRHFEQLSNGDAAAVLGLDKSAASKRYARALIKLKDVLWGMGGGLSEPRP